VEQKMPKKIIKKRKVENEEGKVGWEEYHDFVFPGEEATTASLKLLERARQWKKTAEVE